MKKTTSFIDFEDLCTMKLKKLVPILKPVVTPNMMKDKIEKIDAEVLLYIKKNYAASDLALNQKYFGKKLSQRMQDEENAGLKLINFVSQLQLNSINRNHECQNRQNELKKHVWLQQKKFFEC